MDLRKRSGFTERSRVRKKMERLVLSQDTRFDNISVPAILECGMRSIVLFFFFLVVNFSSDKQYFDSSEVRQSNGLLLLRKNNAKLNGILRAYYKSGEVRYKLQYRDGIKHGPSVEYERNGSVKRKKLYKNGKPFSPKTDRVRSSQNRNEVVRSQKKDQNPKPPATLLPDPTPTNSIGMKFALIPAGKFTMGAPKWEQEKAYKQCVEQGEKESNCKSWHIEAEEEHQVEIAQPFYLGKYEVTQGQWKEVMGWDSWKDSDEFKKNENHPNKFPLEGSSYPVVFISWEDAQEFIKKLNGREGCSNPVGDAYMRPYDLKSGCYRLPTEAEWEYASRAGTKTVNYWGNDENGACIYGNVGDRSLAKLSPEMLGPVVHQCNDGYSFLAKVGSFKPNAWGIYDTIGNVWEWTLDWYSSTYYKRSPAKDPVNLTKGSNRVYRGGSWSNNARDCRSAVRGRGSPGKRDDSLGFRLLRTP